jgi:glycosyltransferase involved in cell wall biosynthesis
MTTGAYLPTGRVLIIGTFLSASRHSHSVCEDIAAGLRGAGWHVTTASKSQSRAGRLIDMLHTTWRTRDEFDVAQVDVYSGWAFIWAEAVSWLLQRLGKPFVLTLHGGNLPNFARSRPTRVRRLLNSASVVTSPSRYLLEQMSVYRSDIRLLPNPIEFGAYTFRVREGAGRRLVWLRAFLEIYNPELAVRVVAKLRNEFPEVQLVMLGPDRGGMAQCRSLAAELAVSDAITFPGGVPKREVPTWLQQADVFINTTNVDNTPVSVVEAMACGLPVVSTNVGGVPYLLDNEHNALLAPPNDADAFAAAVRRVFSEPGLAGRLSHNGRAAAERMSTDVVIPAWASLLHEVSKVRASAAESVSVRNG